MKPRASAPTFPPDDGDPRASRPSHADSSHIARRRASSAPAHEVQLGEVELVEEAPPSSAARPVTHLPAPPRSPPRPSLLPPPRSVPPPLPLPPSPRASRPVFQVPIAVRVLPRRRAFGTPTLALAGGAIALVVGSIVGLAFQPRASRVDFASFAAKTTSALIPAPARSAPPPAAPSEIPVVNVANLPRATTGLVVGADGHRLWIDGTLAASWQATVSCGAHVVQVGSAGTPRTLDVPCGDQIVAAP
jgi:hypothetical protein